MPFGFKESTAKTLLQIARERRTKAQKSDRPPALSNKPLELKAYIVILDDPLPAAVYDDVANEWDLGVGTAAVWRLDTEDNENISRDTDHSIASTKLTPHRDEENACVRYRIFNCLPAVINACNPVPAIQDVFGDLYVVDVAESDTSPAGPTTTTTTTLAPCVNRCKWGWSSSGTWILIEDCEGTTSSTTTTTGTSTTTTTTTTTTTSSTSTTSSTTTSSTTSSTTTSSTT